MKFTIIPSPAGEFVTTTGRRVSVQQCGHGRNFAGLAAFLSAMKLAEHGLAAAKEAKLNALQIAFEKQCATGAVVGGITLDMTPAARATFDEYASHEARRIQFAADDAERNAIRAAPFALKGVDGSLHPMSTEQAVDAIIAAGEIYKGWWAALAQKQAAVAAAQTVAAVNAIE
jgi:hypothetical protein